MLSGSSIEAVRSEAADYQNYLGLWMGIMTTETNERNYFRTAKEYAKTVTNHFNQHRNWIRCPRCIGGNMHHEDSDEFVCMQCGCSYYPDKGTQTPIADGIL